MKTSVIINTYNRANLLRDCLISLEMQRTKDFEVIVINGPSTDATDAVIDEFRDRIKVGRCQAANLSASRNIGIGLAAGEVCAFIDDDAVAHPEWIARIMAPYADDTVAAVGGFTFDHTGTRFQCRYTVCDRQGNAQFFDQIDPSVAFNAPGTWWYPSLLGTNSSFRRSALEQVGGFDEIFSYMLDETDVCLRLFDEGWQIRTIPDAYVFHRYAASHHRTTERIPRSLLAPSRSKAYFCIKHRRREHSIARALGSIDQFQRDLESSNRWNLDHRNLGVDDFYRLNGEVHAGLAEGIALGAQFKNTQGSLPQRQGEPPGFLPYAGPANHPLRLCLVSQGFPPDDTAGIARWTSQLARGLRAVGHEVHVVTATTGEAHSEFSEGMWIHAVPPSPATGPAPAIAIPDSIYRRAMAVREAVIRIRSIWGLDLVSAPIWDLEGILCTADLSVPLVTSLHSTYGLVLPFKEHWQQDFVYRRLHVQRMIEGEQWLLRNSAAILANSSAILSDIEANYAMALDRRRVFVVPHGVDDVGPRRRAEPSGNAPRLRLLHVGRIERRKGLDVLLRALMRLGPRSRDLQIDIVGAPVTGELDFSTLVEELSGQLNANGFAGRIHFRGHVDDEQLLNFYEGCDVLVAPSRYESFGLVAIEAMRFGKPILAGRVGGLPEVVRDGVDGWLFDPDLPDELATILNRLLDHPELVAQLGRVARRRYKKGFTIEQMTRQVEQVYTRVIKESDISIQVWPGQNQELIMSKRR